MARRLLLLFVFFSPFSTWLALSKWVRMPILFILAISVLAAPSLIAALFRSLNRFVEDREDILIFQFLALVWISWALGFGAQRSFNHALALNFTFLFYLVLFKYVVRALGIAPMDLARVAALSALTCCAIIIIEFALINFFGFGIRNYFVTGGAHTSNMDYFVRGFYKSGAGTAEEPGSMAFFLNILCPIGLWHFKTAGSGRMFYCLMALYALSLLFLTSSAGIFVLITCLLALSLANARPYLQVLRKLLLPFILLCTTLLGLYHKVIFRFFEIITSDLILKLTLSKKLHSSSTRSETWEQALLDWAKAPFLGNGPGFGVESLGSGYHSLFLTVFADLGSFSLALIVVFFSIIVWKLLSLPRDIRPYFFIPIVGSLLHFNIIGDYFHAPFWIAVGLVQILFAGTPEPSMKPTTDARAI